ncbi:MAG: peroxidase [Acidobacteriota bacterium]
MTRIKTVPVDEAEGRLARVYGGALDRVGHVAQVIQTMSLNGASCHSSIGFYVSIMQAESPLSRAQREMLATVVSRANECHY